MRVYLASPGNQLQADAARDMPVLISYGAWRSKPSLLEWAPSFERVLVDSGAFTELNGGRPVELVEYFDWAQGLPWADAVAGLDDIGGDWRRSMANYERGGFPTYHDTDPPELLPDLVQLARERGGWLGIGLLPPRTNRDDWLERTLAEIPEDLHVHGWALVAYSHHARIDSFDSTHWWREAMKYRTWAPWLTYGECLEIAVKKVERLQRLPMEQRQGALL